MEQTEGHTLSIENRKRVTATQIEAVNSFSASQIVLQYHGGKIIVGGSDMKITAFSKSSGQFTAQGNIDGVKYSHGGSGIKGLFK
ncbi:MAG: YabP/YqfC family sporulation protein [Candidatus Coproplasma sp.]